MSLLALFAALVIEQFRPLNYARWVAAPVRRWAALIERRVNAGEWQHGVLAWGLTVGLGVGLVALIHFLLLASNPVFAWAWSILVLYFTMGFRQFSHHYTEIQLALRQGDIERARALLAEWRGTSRELWSSSDVARLAIEHALVLSHRHVFAVIFWFVLLPGPCGAVLYRLASLLDEMSCERADEPFCRFSHQAFALIDWLPQRATAIAFAIVGDFEDAVYCWRTQAEQWGDRAAGIVLSAGAGAIGVRLGMPVVEDGDVTDRSEIGLNADADVDFMQSAVGLVWRASVLWLLLLFILSLASLAG
jgi:cobalamin biosynthesis protein CobD/CbiB